MVTGATPERDGDGGPSDAERQRDSRLMRFAYRAITANLWLRTAILTIISVVLVVISFKLNVFTHPDIWSFLASGLGIGLLVGAVGTALVQSIIMSSPETFRKLIEEFHSESEALSHSRAAEQLDLIRTVTAEGLRSLEVQTSQLLAEMHRHDMRSIAPGDKALEEAGVTAFYPNAADAMASMTTSLRDPRITTIRLMGLSLSDWLGTKSTSHGSDVPLNLLETVLRGGGVPSQSRPVKLQVLLLDPYCAAARLLLHRSREPDIEGRIRRFKDETEGGVEVINRLQNELARHKNRSSVEVRYYRTIPSFFALTTDTGCFTRPYYAALDTSQSSVPVWQYRSDSVTYRAAEDHFDSIWRYASLDAESILKENSYGTDKGISEAGIYNIYTDLDSAQARIIWLLEDARRRVWMQGISLVHHAGTAIIDHIAEVVHKPEVDTRFLILDPDCDEAYRKSYRDYLLDEAARSNRMLSFDQYRADRSLHENSAVYRNIRYTTQIFAGIIGSVKSSSASLLHYTCAPTSYVLIADDRVLVEQFHYGKPPLAIDSAGTRLQLAREMPLVELRRPRPGLFEAHRRFDPLEVMTDHYEHVFDHFSHP